MYFVLRNILSISCFELVLDSISCGHSDRMYHVSWTVSRLLRLPVSMLRLKGEDGRLIPSYLRVDSAYQNPEIITLSLGSCI